MRKHLINKSQALEIDKWINMAEHVNSTKPTVLISPSLHTALDLKDDLSRFQIITKVTYPRILYRYLVQVTVRCRDISPRIFASSFSPLDRLTLHGFIWYLDPLNTNIYMRRMLIRI
jgi:hypothetical protein